MNLARQKSSTLYILGFTILELMIATAVFAVILLVITTGVIRFTDDYYKGITSAQTQSVARSIALQLASAIQLSKDVTICQPGDPGCPSGFSYICVDNTQYIFEQGTEVIDNAPNPALHQGSDGLVYDPVICNTKNPCLPGNAGCSLQSSERELLGQHMRLAALNVNQIGNGSPKVYSINVKVIYGDDSLLIPSVKTGTPSWANEECSGGSGSQFCAVSELMTDAEQRLQ